MDRFCDGGVAMPQDKWSSTEQVVNVIFTFEPQATSYLGSLFSNSSNKIIEGYDMTLPCAVAKLAVILSDQNLDFQARKEILGRDISQELTQA